MTSQQRPDQRHAIAVYENFEHMRDTLEATRNALNTVVTSERVLPLELTDIFHAYSHYTVIHFCLSLSGCKGIFLRNFIGHT